MKPIEFLSILSTYTPGVTFQTFQSLYKQIDIYDFKNNPQTILSPQQIEKLPKNWFDQIFKDYEFFINNKIHHIYPDHPAYPKDFYSLEYPPLFLSLMGDLNCLNKDKISVVGSRHPSAQVLEWMDLHMDSVVSNEIVTVSGAARGIDQKIHSISLRNLRPTIAFLPSGLGQIYPAEFARWKDKIIETGGLLVSEYRYNQAIHSHHFHERNRMIAKLGLIVFVCEARRKSGSSMTARLAIENSKTVCVLPGFPTHKNSQGCLDLLFQGAIPIRDAEDLNVLIEAEKMSLEGRKNLLFVPDFFKRIDGGDKE